MGGAGLYHPPIKVKPTGFASWTAHTERDTPSTEPGLDVYTPRFTELFAAASGVVVEIDFDIVDPTGRFITIDLDDGQRVRYLHLEEIFVRVGQRVAWGELIGKTGATGYGDADWSWNIAGTGGAHVHMTVFPGHYYVFGRYATVDPYPLIDWSITQPPKAKGDDDMRAIIQAGQPDSGIIIEAGVPPYSLPGQTFDALCGAYGLEAVTLADWQYGTVVREQWRAAGAAASLEPNDDGKTLEIATDAIVSGVLSGIDESVARLLPVDEILKRIAALPEATLAALKAAL